MTHTDLSNQAALRIVLHDQRGQLVSLRADVGALLLRSRPTISAHDWHGPAYELYERMAHQLTFEVANVAAALDEAAIATERGLRTLGEGFP